MVMEEMNKHLESMNTMFERLSGGPLDEKGRGGGDVRMNELERLLQDTRQEKDKLRRQVAEMEDLLAQHR